MIGSADIVMGLLSGSFFGAGAQIRAVVRVLLLTINYWAVDAFLSLAIGRQHPAERRAAAGAAR